MDILIPRFNRTIHLNGPRGIPTIVPAMGKSAPSLRVATAAQKAIADTIKRLSDTAGGEFYGHEYGVTDVPSHFWEAFRASHEKADVITKKIAFVI